ATPPVAEPAHHLAEHAPQPLLLPGGVAQLSAGVGLIATLLLAALACSPLLPLLALLLGANAAVEQLLLALHHLAHPAPHLLRLARPLLRHLSRPRHSQVFEHVLQL